MSIDSEYTGELDDLDLIVASQLSKIDESLESIKSGLREILSLDLEKDAWEVHGKCMFPLYIACALRQQQELTIAKPKYYDDSTGGSIGQSMTTLYHPSQVRTERYGWSILCRYYLSLGSRDTVGMNYLYTAEHIAARTLYEGLDPATRHQVDLRELVHGYNRPDTYDVILGMTELLEEGNFERLNMWIQRDEDYSRLIPEAFQVRQHPKLEVLRQNSGYMQKMKELREALFMQWYGSTTAQVKNVGSLLEQLPPKAESELRARLGPNYEDIDGDTVNYTLDALQSISSARRYIRTDIDDKRMLGRELTHFKMNLVKVDSALELQSMHLFGTLASQIMSELENPSNNSIVHKASRGCYLAMEMAYWSGDIDIIPPTHFQDGLPTVVIPWIRRVRDSLSQRWQEYSEQACALVTTENRANIPILNGINSTYTRDELLPQVFKKTPGFALEGLIHVMTGMYTALPEEDKLAVQFKMFKKMEQIRRGFGKQNDFDSAEETYRLGRLKFGSQFENDLVSEITLPHNGKGYLIGWEDTVRRRYALALDRGGNPITTDLHSVFQTPDAYKKLLRRQGD